jgi:uncharacterized membrane protein
LSRPVPGADRVDEIGNRQYCCRSKRREAAEGAAQWDPASMEQLQVRARGRILSVGRVLLSLAVGVVAGVLVAVLVAPVLAPLVGWAVAATTVLVWVWWISWPLGAEGTKRLAEEEQRSRSTDGGVLVAAVVSLAAVVLALVRSSSNDAIAGTLVVVSVVAVTLSWALVNTVFALKYSRLYYKDETDVDGGINFMHEHPPAYSDFAYVAFTVGMSYAVSDTEVTSSDIRRVALGHALLSYGFGTGILAVAVNLVTNLAQQRS